MKNPRRLSLSLAFPFLLAAFFASPLLAQTTVTVRSPTGETTQELPAEGGPFEIDLPLAANAVNSIIVSATDEDGNRASEEIVITQISLDSVVVAEVSSEQLSPEEIEELVNEGVIDLDDPENYNVSRFVIVITVEGEPVEIVVHIPHGQGAVPPGGEERIPMPGEDGPAGRPPPSPREIIVFEELIPVPGQEKPVSLPGVLIIEGRIRSLKEFFSVRLLLMNTSGIFTLSGLEAQIVLPEGALSNTLPASGTVLFDDILPGDGSAPGQAEREFIVRGDQLGVHDVRVDFGGVLTGPGIPENSPVPFSGDAHTSLEVKGPPTFEVQVFHPASIVAHESYDLRVDITNTGEVPALYASLDLEVGADMELVHCTVDESGEPSCTHVEGPVTRALGHIYPAQRVSETFEVRSFVTGLVSSCLGMADQNITLQVIVGNKGCMAGHFPALEGVPEGVPTVSVLPAANTTGISTDTAVTAFFSEPMDYASITTGEGGSFNVYHGRRRVAGQVRFDEIFDRTVAFWQTNDGAANRLEPNTEYTILLTQEIKNRPGVALYNEWMATFSTTGDDLDDITPPELNLSVEAPVDPNFVLPGRTVRVNAYATDQGSGVARVEARLKDLDIADARYELIDQRSVQDGNTPPYIFAIESADLVPGHSYRVLVSAYDAMGNPQDASLTLLIAASADPPTLVLPEDPGRDWLQGISLDLTPLETTGGTHLVRYYLDGDSEALKTVYLAPYSARLDTLELALGAHSVRAVAEDGLAQHGEDTLDFNLVENPSMPQVDFGSSVDGAVYLAGETFIVNGHAEDEVGIAKVLFYLDEIGSRKSDKSGPIAEGTDPFRFDTTGLATGDHTIHLVATNSLGVTNDAANPESYLEFTVVDEQAGSPPGAPIISSVSPPTGGLVTVSGTSVAGARVDITNETRGFTITVYADASGAYSGVLDGEGGDAIRVVAIDTSQSPDPSEASTAVVPLPPVLLRIEQTPALLSFDEAGESADLTVTAVYDDGSDEIVTGQCAYTTSDAGVATVSSSGTVVAHSDGEAIITASFEDQQDTSEVRVSDRTAPEVETTEPEAGTYYNFGDTVTIVIEASDEVGVQEIRYETGGALDYSESKTIEPPAKQATATFHFDVPYGVEDPEVLIHGFATDTSGNEGAAPAVPIELTGSDITPPATEGYSATDPGTNATTTISYRVTDGLDDLDHVELYFRRDNLGTFNRYTNAPGGNAEGHYHPTGAEGTILFDSTRMGGDGSFEFYTAGVDQAGNREEAPEDGAKAPAADLSQAIAAGTSWRVITEATFIATGDTSYDLQNLRISGAELTLEGHHEFHNVELVSASLTHQESGLDHQHSLDLSAWTLSVDASSSINVSARGYLGGNHEGNECTGQTAEGLEGSTYRSGGSHGGGGGVYGEGIPGPAYGDLTAPVAPGSGGSCGSSARAGGDGGGVLEIHATNVINDGIISASGGNGSGAGSGSGAGGSIYLVVSTVSGRGRIATNGGAYEVGGGGGRIAIHFTDLATLDKSLLEAVGGQGSWAVAGNGTVFLKGTGESAGTLVVDGQGSASTFTSLPIPPGYVFDNIILQNNARTLADDLLEVTDSLEVLSGSILTHSTESEDGLRIKARRVYVDESSFIDVSARGYRGGLHDGNENARGLTLGGLPGAEYRAGGSYGGYGGIYNGPGSNLPYGHPGLPHALGSGGSSGSSSRAGGNGGGRVTIEASGEVHVAGAILAAGQRGFGSGAGSGSGGSIDISTSLLRGSGRIAADGGVYEVGGGGGRVAIRYAYLSTREDRDFDGLRNITAFGGHGSWAQGSAGTVLMVRSDQDLGDFYVDDAQSGATAGNWTPLTHIGFGQITDLTEDTITTDGLVTFLPGALVGIEVNPNLDQQETFTILENDETTITVDISGGTRLTDVATIDDRYEGVYRFDNLSFRRGGFLVVGDQLRVEDTLLLDEHGRLTHFDATMDFVSRLDLFAETLEVRETASINLDTRGYLGGNRPGNDCTGQSEGNTDGSAYRSGGSYGGYGATHDGTPGLSYGSLTHPADLGSGGSCGSSARAGGDGGGHGVIRAERILLDGVISAGGARGGGAGAGSGSGGALRIETDELSGTGFLRANGGAYEVGGGGGRIAIAYETLLLDQSHIEVLGGRGSWAQAGNGTLFLESHAQSLGDLVIDGHGASTPAGSSPIPGGYEFDNIILRGASQVIADDGLSCSGALRLLGGSILTHSTQSEAGLTIEVADVEIDESSAIDVSGRGYRGGYRDGNTDSYGLTLGALPGAEYRAGGSYGGYGAIFEGTGNNLPYGHPGAPRYLGSGGSSGSSARAGGNGGGLIRLDASEGIHIAGAIRANGQSGAGAGAGSGSGGSIDIRTSLLEGSGSISAGGGAYEVGGGGGRVAISYSDLGDEGQDFSGLRTITALGGHGSWQWGSAGSVLLKKQGDPRGELVIDDNHEGATSRNWTPLTHIGFGQSVALDDDTLTTDGTIAMLPNGLAGMEINPNLDQGLGFTILSNTETTITVDISSGTLLTDVASVGDPYGGVYRFDRLSFRRGGFLVVGDRLLVEDTVFLDEYGRLTHFDATLDISSRLELTAGSIELTVTGFIDADGRGYLGGSHGGNPCPGQTPPGLAGATYRSGGSYGGLGASYAGGTPNPVYGNTANPADLGSGGSCGSSNRGGGDGGGYLLLTADEITINGVISANGLGGGGGGAGSGSGGSIMIDVGDLYGTGVIRADGGAYEVGGGGGRIAIIFEWKELSDENITASGGQGSWAQGAEGSVEHP